MLLENVLVSSGVISVDWWKKECNSQDKKIITETLDNLGNSWNIRFIEIV